MDRPFFGQQGAVAHTGRNEHDVTVAQAVLLRSQQILRTAAGTVYHLVKCMAVELHAVAALAYVPVRVYKTGAHFQLLIDVHEPEPVFFQLCLPLSGESSRPSTPAASSSILPSSDNFTNPTSFYC